MRTRWLGLGVVLFLALAWAAGGGVSAQRADPSPADLLPPLSDMGLPPLPTQSARNANYTIEARLDPERHTIQGTLLLEWRNTTGQPQTTFPFHLYWNAFRNNLSTSARGEGRRAARAGGPRAQRGFGYTQVRSASLLLDGGEADLLPTLQYVQPDDGNTDDRTVVQLTTPNAIPPDGVARFRIGWNALMPYGDVGRSGWVHDYHFVAQWFPKIGVWWKGAWNAHEFHPWTEFFSDYGVYDVKLTVPEGFVVGATGTEAEPAKENGDGTRTLHFRQADVHDFTWVTSRRLVERRGRFADVGYPPVDIRLLVEPEHEFLSERYLEATKTCLRSYGAWDAPYPYPQVTVVDPAWNSASGGMEYPTLFTGGASVFAPPALQSPEGVTIHECGHQFWYALVGNNEFEEAWLDEGFNTYHETRASALFLGPEGWGRRYFGLLSSGRGSRSGYPVVAPGVWIGRGEGELGGLRHAGETDVMARRGWEYRTQESYGLNSYGKPALSLQTLEGLVGEETMTRILRTYARRYRFAHPTSEDFIAVVNEVTGQDWRGYFDQTWFSSDLCDYGITARNAKARALEGYAEGPGGQPIPAPPRHDRGKDGDRDQGPFDSEVTILRLGGVKLPVEVLVEFSDGRIVQETWDGQYRWKRLEYHGGARVVSAIVDPYRKIALDVNPSNNTWLDETGPQARRAAAKWSVRWMFWLQNLLELQTLLG